MFMNHIFALSIKLNPTLCGSPVNAIICSCVYLTAFCAAHCCHALLIFFLSRFVVALLRYKMEQCVNLKFLVNLGKGPTNCLKLLHEVYGKAAKSRARLFEWHKRFTSGREDVEDDPKSGRPSTTKTADNISKVNEFVQSDRRLAVRMMAEELDINRESVRTILLELHMRKVPKIVPKLLSDNQKQHRVRVCEDKLERIGADPDFLGRIITGDEFRVFQYDPETKRQSQQ